MVMVIVELNTVTEAQVQEVIALMGELDPEVPVTGEMVRRTVGAESTHFFAAMEGERIVGCASLCVFDSPTGRKASIEDVVVREAFRGQGLGKMLMQRAIECAEGMAPISLQLTSRPMRRAANAMYRALGFRQRETNAYRMEIPGQARDEEDRPG